MRVEGLRVGFRHHPGCRLPEFRADGAEDVGPLVTLIFGLRRARATFRPLVDQRVFLPDPGLILEPDFDPFVFGLIAQLRNQTGNGLMEFFLNAARFSGSPLG